MWIRLSYVMGMYWGFGDLFTGLQIMTILVLGTVEAVNGNISVGTFMAFISYNATLVWPIRSLGRVLSEMSKARCLHRPYQLHSGGRRRSRTILPG